MPTNDMGSHKCEPDLLRFTIALQRPDGVNYTSDYYRQQFSATFQDNFAPEKGYLGYDYHYELRFDEFIRETSREEWRFVLKSVEGFAELGLRVVVEGYSIFIEGKPTRAFDGTYNYTFSGWSPKLVVLALRVPLLFLDVALRRNLRRTITEQGILASPSRQVTNRRITLQ